MDLARAGKPTVIAAAHPENGHGYKQRPTRE
jgi:hypothetical protein